MLVLTKRLIENAVALMAPYAFAVLEEKEATWGPRWVTGFIKGPGLEIALPFQLGFPPKAMWNKLWGNPEEFGAVAHKQMRIHEMEGLPKDVKIDVKPKLREEEDYHSGGAHQDGISVGAAGATKPVNNAIAEVLIDTIEMLAGVEEENRAKATASANAR